MARRMLLPLVLLGFMAGLLLPPTFAAPPTDAPRSQAENEETYELYKMLADAVDQVERNYVKEISRRELIEAALEGIIKKLDPYSSYISPEQLNSFRTSVENKFGGIGIQITIDAGQLKVLSPLVGTPAYRAGLQAGDKITKIEDKPTKGISISEAVRQLKGKADTSVTMTIVHANDPTPITVTIQREIIRVQTVLGDRRNTDDSWDFVFDHDKHLGYIRLTAFSRDTASDLRKALESLKKQGLRGLVIDLRFNPGGLLSSAIEISDLFISDGRIVSTEGRNSKKRVWNAHKPGTFEGFPMAVLVNRYSASASEIVSGCLQDHDRAVIIGERTWGKGSVQNVIELENGRSALKLTTAGYLRPSGKNIHRFPDAKETDVWGVTPDSGFQLKLSTDDLSRLMKVRRDRDIVSHKLASESLPPLPEVGAPPEPKANEEEPDAEGGFVDRQLQQALDYLNQELASAE